jgi:hexosaminidase
LRTMHVGGDELPDGTWERSPASRALMNRQHLKTRADLWDYFYARVGTLLQHHDVALSGWEEVGARTVRVDGHTERVANPAFSRSGYTVYVWRNTEGAEDLADRLANAGYDTVLTPANRLYFDLPPYPSPFEPGQVWAGYVDLDTVFDYVPLDDTRIAPDDPRHLANRQTLTEFGRQHIRGLEGTLFSETVHEPSRLDYMLMPRMVALAERAWAPDPRWTKQPDHAHAAPLHAAAWSTFVSQLGLKVLPQLDAEHAVLYRIPAPGLKEVAGAVLVNQQIPGFSLRYTVDGSEPKATSPLVTGPITHAGPIRVAAVDRNGRVGRSSRVDLR